MVATDQEVSVETTRRTPVVVGLLSLGVTLLGMLVLVGWFTGDETITRLFPVLVAMQPATAVDFVLLGLATLLLHCGWARDRVPEVVPLLAVLSVVVIAGTGLVTELAGWSYPITILGDMSQNEGRMSGITAVAHLVIAFSLLATVTGRTLVAHSAGVLALTIGLVGLSGYAFGPSDLYDVGYFQTLALHTALGIALLGMALVSGSGEVGLTKLARSHPGRPSGTHPAAGGARDPHRAGMGRAVDDAQRLRPRLRDGALPHERGPTDRCPGLVGGRAAHHR